MNQPVSQSCGSVRSGSIDVSWGEHHIHRFRWREQWKKKGGSERGGGALQLSRAYIYGDLCGQRRYYDILRDADDAETIV